MELQMRKKASLDALGGAGCPSSAQPHTDAVKPRMKGLDLVYFCQVNKSRCFACCLTFVIKVQSQLFPLSLKQSQHLSAPNLTTWCCGASGGIEDRRKARLSCIGWIVPVSWIEIVFSKPVWDQWIWIMLLGFQIWRDEPALSCLVVQIASHPQARVTV